MQKFANLIPSGNQLISAIEHARNRYPPVPELPFSVSGAKSALAILEGQSLGLDATHILVAYPSN